MQLITPPLQQTDQGKEVKNLHDVLVFLVEMINNQALNARFHDTAFQALFKEDIQKNFYGAATTKLVFFLQEFLQEHGFKIGVIDELTAQTFNDRLKAFGGLEVNTPSKPLLKKEDEIKAYRISGKLLPAVKNMFVTALNKNLRTEIILGRQQLTEAGSFSIEYNPVFRKAEYRSADIFFRLQTGDQETSGFSVFEITGNEKNFLQDGILFNAGENAEVEIYLSSASATPPLSEFEEIDKLIQPLLEDVKVEALNEDENHQDFSFLSRETGWDKQKIIRYALSARLHAQSDLDTRFWYALTAGDFFGELSAGFEHDNLFKNIPAIITALVAVSSKAAEAIVKKAMDENIIQASLKEKLAHWLLQFAAFSSNNIVHPGYNEQPLYINTLMNSSGLPAGKHNRLVDIYLQHGEVNEHFWEQLKQEDWLDEKDRNRLHFTHSLTTLGDHNEKLVALAAVLPKVSSLRDLALEHDSQSIAKLLTSEMLPEGIAGDTPLAKINHYAASLQQSLFAKETSAVLQRMATEKELPIKEENVRTALVAFLDNQPGFNIRTTSVYHAIKTKEAFNGIPEKHQDAVITQLKTLQRVQAISPVHHVVATMMKANITTAQQVTEIPEANFIAAFSDKMGSQTAKQVYANATNVKLRNEQALMSMKEAVQGSGISLIDGPGAMDDRKLAFDAKAAEQNISVNWDSLFGSVDFCACGECTSVYSPAAYFVELLQYLRNNDLDLKATGVQAVKINPADISGTVLEKLFRRRPDLGCLELTCANTNTILPYLDIVNEVMESFVVHLPDYAKSTVVPKKALIDPWNVEGETSDELMAEPQHINNNAYLQLKKAVYPCTLPYDRPLDMIRTFLEYLDTSRYELMSVFRSVEQKVIPASIMPEDSLLPPVLKPDPNESKVPPFHKVAKDRALVAEDLKMGQEEYVILTKEAFLTKDYFDLRIPGITDGQYREKVGVKTVPEYYGYAAATGKADMLDTDEGKQLGLTFVKKQFLKRTGVAYADLVELLKTQSLNPLYPAGKPLVVLQSIPFSYRFLQSLVDKTSNDPKIKFKKLIGALQHPADYIPGYDGNEAFNPCKPPRQKKPAFLSVDIQQWVFCYFERIGQMIVLENGTSSCVCPTGQFVSRNGGTNIMLGNVEGDLFLNAACELVLKHKSKLVLSAPVGHVDAMTGLITLTDGNGQPLDPDILTMQNVIFNGDNGEKSIVTQGRLISQRTEKPFGCKQPAADNCDLTRVRLRHLDGSGLGVTEYDKFQRFIRLWRKTGWSIDDTDKALVGLTADKTVYTKGFNDACDPEIDPKGFAEITPGLLEQVAAVKKMLDKTGLELVRLLAFWTAISTRGDKSLYQRLFLIHNLVSLDNVFRADDNGNFLTAPEKAIDHIPVLMAAFHVKYEELAALLSPADPLDLPTVSRVYRQCLLAKLLRIKTANLKNAFLLFGTDPFKNALGALSFFNRWDRLDAAGLTFPQLDYVIRDNDDLLKPLRPAKTAVIGLSKNLYDGLNAIDRAHPDLQQLSELVAQLYLDAVGPAAKQALLQSIATEELVRQKVSLLYDVASAELILGLLQGSFGYSITVPTGIAKTKDEFTKAFPDATPALQQSSAILLKKLSFDAQAGKLQVTGLLTPPEVSTLEHLFTGALWQPSFADINGQAQYAFDDLLALVFQHDLVNAKKIILGPDITDPVTGDNITAPVKREYFLSIFLPFLRDKLKTTLIVSLLASASGVATDATQTLISNILETISGKTLLDSCKEANKPLTGTGWKGWLIPAANDSYVFSVNVNVKTFSVMIDGNLVLDEKYPVVNGLYMSKGQKLATGQTCFLEISGLKAGLEDLNWNQPAAPKATLPAEVLLPMESFAITEEALTKLHKAGIIVNNFLLVTKEINWLQDHGADFDKLDFNALTLTHLLRLEAYTRLRDTLPATDLSLPDFFNWAVSGAGSPLPAEQIAVLMLRKKEDIDAMTAATHLNLLQSADFTNEINLLKLADAFALFDKINMKIDSLFEWAEPVSQFAICLSVAETIRKSIQARYRQEDWEKVIKPLNDGLRDRQRVALINYLLVQQELIVWGVVDADSLFEFFLIDVQMDACMQTSRLKQAISTVQLFVQRCFLGEEASRDIGSDVLNAHRWETMQRNPLWVAHRKIFLYPENWLLENLRDDKSPFYKELESDMLQNDIQQENVRDALHNYLYKVDEVANMEVVGFYIEMEIDTAGAETNTPFKLHVFARTRNAPYSFYYRLFNIKEVNWFAWEKIQVDIPSYNVIETPIYITIENWNIVIPAGTRNQVLDFDGTIDGYPASMSKFSSHALFNEIIALLVSADGIVILPKLENISFDIKNQNASVTGSIYDVQTIGGKSVGKFAGKMTRKSNTNGCYLIPVIWNSRLLLFFPQIKKNTQSAGKKDDSKGSFSQSYDYYEIKMAWTEYRNGKWTQKQVSKESFHSGPIAGTIAIEYFKFIPDVLPDKVLIAVDDRWDEDGISLGAFLFDGNSLWKSDIGTLDVMPFNYFHKIEQFPPVDNSKIFSWQIKNGKRANSSICFENGVFKEFIGGIASARNFFHPYSHDLLGRINLDDLSHFFEYNLGIADKVDAFGKGATNTYNELYRPYSLYNWELFFHVPFQIANELSANQHFEAAMKWYHYIFDPTATGTDPRPCWKFLPFKEIDTGNYLEKIFSSLQPNTPNEEITNWRNNPFQPHVIARTRPIAYMKNVVMKYLDNLLAWGDYLFKQDTIETINYATQLYVLASHLSPVATMIPRQGKIKPETYNSLLNKWDAFGNAMVELELVAPFSQQITTSFSSIGNSKEIATANIFGFASSLYFCIPNNPQLMAYRDLIADRLYKIRHCENIEGVFRILPLWDPPIDPALLVAAAAQGLSIDNLLNDLNTPIPNYRFIYLLQKAIDLCNEVKSLGNALLSAFEKNDGEALAAMRATHETSMHNFVMDVKKLQVEEAGTALEGLQQNRITSEYRLRHYLQQLGEDTAKIPASGDAFSELSDPVQMTFVESGLRLIQDEHEEMDKAATAHWWQMASTGVEILSGALHALPDQLTYDIVGFAKDGGSHMGKAASEAAKVLQIVSSIYAFESANAQKKAGFRRQMQDRILQANLAGYECMQIDKQIASQQIRIKIANQEIDNQQHMIDHAVEAESFIKDKFTNEALYKWMKGQLKATYRQGYDLAWDWAKKAEKVYCFERGITNTNFLNGGSWDAGYEGLLAGEKLYLGLKKLEAAYHDTRGHDFEITKLVSLMQLDPLALVELRTTGKCSFTVPEEIFDMDFPGHYMRRIKSIALSIPCIAGPYASVNATLRLQAHSYRISAIAANNDYARKTGEEDERFASAHIPVAAIATSTGQHDTGLFELNFKDERYMPFEGAGAISSWKMELPDTVRQFNYETIADVIMHISYTAKDGGDKLKVPANKAIAGYIKSINELGDRQGLFAFFDIKNDFPNEWYKALELPAGAAGSVMELGNLGERLPFFARGKIITAKDIYLVSDANFKPVDLAVRHQATSLGAISGVQSLSTTTSIARLPDLTISMNTPADKWSIHFTNPAKKPVKLWMIVRYTVG